MHTRNNNIVAGDYWRLRIRGSDSHATILIQGRRRTTESFWPPLELTTEQFERFVDTIANAAAIAVGFREDRRPSPPLFPAYEIVAACQGSCYWLEVTETTVVAGSSVTVIVYSVQSTVQPVLYLVDDGIAQCHEDLQRFQRLLASETTDVNGSHTSHPVEPAVAAVRDATLPARCRVIPSANGWRDE